MAVLRHSGDVRRIALIRPGAEPQAGAASLYGNASLPPSRNRNGLACEE